MSHGITTDQAVYRISRATGIHTAENLNLQRARLAYATGRLSTEKLEAAIEHILRGGYLDTNLELRSPLLDRVRARRRCATHGHILIDATGYGDPDGLHICQRCDYRET